MTKGLRFGFQVGPVATLRGDDKSMYREVVEDAEFGDALGYDSVWMVEHHFTDYYPTPSPFLFLSHIAARCPTLGLGTSVLVLPWYDPLRFAEEVAMLNLLTEGELHLGVGRGTAKLEYDAFGVDMEEARDRFAEGMRLVETALRGDEFTFEGKFYNVRRPVKVRPRVGAKRPHFYGAIGSPASAGIMAELGLPPVCISHFPLEMLRRILATWTEAAEARPHPVPRSFPIVTQCYIGDTDEEAQAEAKRFLPPYFRLQVEHYEIDANPWAGVKGYEQFSRYFGNLKKLSDPENLGPYLDLQLIGSVETVSERLRALVDLGFDHIVVSNATPGVPKAVRHRMLRRFAEEVRPHFEAAPAPRLRAANG